MGLQRIEVILQFRIVGKLVVALGFLLRPTKVGIIGPPRIEVTGPRNRGVHVNVVPQMTTMVADISDRENELVRQDLLERDVVRIVVAVGVRPDTGEVFAESIGTTVKGQHAIRWIGGESSRQARALI